jgi:hypothetical protein
MGCLGENVMVPVSREEAELLRFDARNKGKCSADYVRFDLMVRLQTFSSRTIGSRCGCLSAGLCFWISNGMRLTLLMHLLQSFYVSHCL